jgi:tRNA(fMet)-specific endonuclease VapC
VILDTSAYSNFVRGQSEITELLKTMPLVYIPDPVIGELKFGYLNGNRYEQNMAILTSLLSRNTFEILHIDTHTTDFYAETVMYAIKNGKAISTNDAWIAALAIQHKLPLVSYDKDFEGIKDLFMSQLHTLKLY